MQRKQQVRECWVCVIFFSCVCVGASDLTTVSDDPSLVVLFVSSTPGTSYGGPMGGGGELCPSLVMHSIEGSASIFFFRRFCYFSGFCYF
jgi:hypothetical protein